MYLIDIVPVSNLHMVKHDPAQMFLTHLVLKNKEYAEYAKNYQGFKILDNSLIENAGKSLNIYDVLEAAEIIGAHEIILPDKYMDGPGTIESTFNALDICKNYPYDLMAVVHGKDVNEWVETFNILDNEPRITTLGIPKVCSKMSPSGRPFFEQFWQNSTKKIHLLGLWYSYTELLEYENINKIRSMDTCLASYFAKNNGTALSVRPDGFTIDLDNDVVDAERFLNIREERIECLLNLTTW